MCRLLHHPGMHQQAFELKHGTFQVEIAGEELKVGAGGAEVGKARFSFRPARSLLDSAEKVRTPPQPQPVIPTPEKVIAENDRAAAAASQPLPVSDDDEDEDEEHGDGDGDGSEDGDIKGVMRSSARPKENGDTPATTSAAAPVSSTGGWDLSFLKKNQADAAAATAAAEKAIAAERGGAQPEPQAQASASAGGWDLGFLKQNQAQAAAASEAAKKAIEAERGGAQSEPQQQKSVSTGGWDLAFLSANKAAVGAASAAAKAEVDKAAGTGVARGLHGFSSGCRTTPTFPLMSFAPCLQALLLRGSPSALVSRRHRRQTHQLLQAQACFNPCIHVCMPFAQAPQHDVCMVQLLNGSVSIMIHDFRIWLRIYSQVPKG